MILIEKKLFANSRKEENIMKKVKKLVSMNEELHIFLKEVSKNEGISLNAYINIILQDYRKKMEEEKTRKA